MDWLREYTAAWHDTWEIVAALATSAAVLVALLSIRTERRRARAEHERAEHATAQAVAERARSDAWRAEQADAARRAQALRVIAYPARKAVFRSIGGTSAHTWELKVANHSDAPIFDVHVTVSVGDWHDEVTLELLSAYEMVSHPTDRLVRDPQATATIHFRDVAGLRWTRHSTGELLEQRPESSGTGAVR